MLKIADGSVITAIPLFFGLQQEIVTELCLSLRAFPALKGQIVVREGMPGVEMYTISNGKLRVVSSTPPPYSV